MRSTVGLLLCVVMTLLHSSQGWWDTGHMIVAQIGYNYLNRNETEQTRAALQNAFDALQTYYADSGTFVTSACWMDDLKKRSLNQFNNWHFINVPVCDDGITVCEGISVRNLVNEGDNIVWAINEAISTIRSKTAGGFERGFAMKTLLHLVGDIHQPLHSVDRYSNSTPNGDAGGNDFKIQPIFGITSPNLHKLWDSGAGLFDNELVRPFNSANQSYIESWAQTIASKLNISEIGSLTNITEWAVESVSISRQYVYDLPFDSLPSAEYIANAQMVIQQRIGIAGYRLAQLLKQIVLCDANTHNCPILGDNVPCPEIPAKTHPVGYTITATVLSVALVASVIVNAVFIYKYKQTRKGYTDLRLGSNSH